jgi:hypothetical protein
MSDELALSVVVPTYGRPDLVREVLAVLRPQMQGGDEIVFVDDGGDPPAELDPSSSPSARVVRQENAGPAAARNLGAAEAKNDWLVFLDDDCVPGESHLSAWREALRATPGSLVFGRVTSRMPSIEPFITAFNINDEHKVQGGANVGCHRDVFARTGGFGAEMRVAEDIAFKERAARAGIPIRSESSVEVFHPIRRGRVGLPTVKQVVAQCRRQAPAWDQRTPSLRHHILRVRLRGAAVSTLQLATLGPVLTSGIYLVRGLQKRRQASEYGVEIPTTEVLHYALAAPYQELVRLVGFLKFYRDAEGGS